MDLLTFIASLVRDLAWPIATIVGLLILLSNASMLPSIIESIKYKDIEIILRKEFAQARAVAEKIRPRLGGEKLPIFDSKDPIFKIAKMDPGLAIVEIWRRLEEDITKLIQTQGLMRFYSPANFAKRLAAKGFMSVDELVLFEKLRNIRNNAVHAQSDASKELTLAEITEFNEFANLLRLRFAQIPATPGLFDPD